MTFSEKIKNIAVAGDLFPELSSAEKKYSYIAADVAVKIRDKRKELNMTQKDFAEYLNVSQSMVSKWESADYNFTLESLVQLFDRLDIKIDLKERPQKSNMSSYKIVFFNNPWLIKGHNNTKKTKIENSGVSA